jgi:hypothetical protein
VGSKTAIHDCSIPQIELLLALRRPRTNDAEKAATAAALERATATPADRPDIVPQETGARVDEVGDA